MKRDEMNWDIRDELFLFFLCLFVCVSSFSCDGLFRMNGWMNE